MFALRQSFKSVKCAKILTASYSSSSNFVKTVVDDKTGIATVTLQRPPVNSLNYEVLSELSNALTELDNNKSRGMILTSGAKSVFSGGLDITEMYKPDQERVKLFWTALQDTWLQLYGSSFPTVAAINGHSPAGGCLLAMCCEYRVMLPNFTIGLNETQLGIVAPTWFMASMKNTISTREAELALTTGRLFKTEEALKVGLIDEIATDYDDCIARCNAFLNKFKKISPLARFFTKSALRNRDIQALVNKREEDLELFLSLVNDPNVQKGLGVYLEGMKKKK